MRRPRRLLWSRRWPCSRSASRAVRCPAGRSAPPRRSSATSATSSNGAQVQLADVPVGSVSSIALDGDKAKVTLAFDNGVRIPADVSAAIDRTTILGDQFVRAHRAQERDRRAAAATAPQLANGAVIDKTSVVPDVEQFIAGGVRRVRRRLDERARADHPGRGRRASPGKRRRSRRSSPT